MSLTSFKVYLIIFWSKENAIHCHLKRPDFAYTKYTYVRIKKRLLHFKGFDGNCEKVRNRLQQIIINYDDLIDTALQHY